MTDVTAVLIAEPLESGAPETAATPFEYAGFGIRLGARVIDLAIMAVAALATGALSGILAVVLSTILGIDTSGFLAGAGETGLTARLMAVLAAMVFAVVADSIHGSTPGKMILGLTVLGENGGFCSAAAAVRRELAYLIDSLFFGIPAFSSMKRTPKQQRIGDKWARTIVVRRRSLQPGQRHSGFRFALATVAAIAAYAVVIALSLVV